MSSVISTVESRLYRLPLPVTLSDSTHGDMTHFELVVLRLRDDDGVEGTGYTYTVGHGGGAVLCRRHRPRVPDRRAAAPGRRLPGRRHPRDQDEGGTRQPE